MESAATFDSLPLDPALRATLQQLGFAHPTPVQALALPVALAGKDVIARAATGSGKTAVFALTLLQRLQLKFFAVQALVLCPTRELADQVAVEVRRLGRSRENLKVVVLCGGVPLRGQVDSLAHGAHVVVGTPGRVQDHLSRKTLTLEGLRTLVFDEADRMLDLGFIDDMKAIAALCPRERQSLLFSATFPPQIDEWARPFLRNPVMLEASTPEKALIEERFYPVVPETRLVVLASLLGHFRPEATLVFVNTKVVGREVVSFLRGQGVAARELSGDLEQRDRDEVMMLFAGRCLSVLVATDVASRGLDVAALDAVINFELSPDAEVHVHRIGRTGRAGVRGLALSLAAGRDAHRQPLYAISELEPSPLGFPQAPRSMLKLLDGKKEKIRPADVLGALTAAAGFSREQVGAIKVTEWGTWIAVDRDCASAMVEALSRTPVKGRLRRVVRVEA